MSMALAAVDLNGAMLMYGVGPSAKSERNRV